MPEQPRYESVRVPPAGDSTPARFGLTAAEYGYDGIVVRNRGDAMAEFDAGAIQETYGIDVVDGVEIVAEDPSRASGYLGSHRPETSIVAVRGGSDPMNRFAVEQPAVDVLSNPTTGEAEPDQVLVRTAADHGVRIEVALGGLVAESGGRRVRTIEDLRQLWTLIDHYDAPYVVTVGADSHLELRGPRELAALGGAIGLEPEDVRHGLGEWCRLAERNRRRLSDDFVEPGVWRE